MSEPSTCSCRGPFVNVPFTVREERPPLMGMWLISTEAGDTRAWGPGPAKSGQDALSVPGAGEGDPASVGGWTLWSGGNSMRRMCPG